jgi:hypothetical protein
MLSANYSRGIEPSWIQGLFLPSSCCERFLHSERRSAYVAINFHLLLLFLLAVVWCTCISALPSYIRHFINGITDPAAFCLPPSFSSSPPLFLLPPTFLELHVSLLPPPPSLSIPLFLPLSNCFYSESIRHYSVQLSVFIFPHPTLPT